MLRDLIIKNRSYRRFDFSFKIPEENLKNWIELARFSASGRNMQPLKYLISTNEKINEQIFPNLGWAGYLSNWKGPAENERPVAYIIVLNDKSLAANYFCDDGLAMQNILLGAVEDGFGGCIIGSVNKGRVAKLLELPEHLEILWIIALGKPAEEIVLEEMQENDVKYWRDENGAHHVPKRPAKEIIYKKL
ncbi:nitroreductase family protein [Maribellus maritimus]|uniref:nitroreductase family protein n=1 Tax=Maribellus maritimus TaxID=2870838 RepID=UPI001EE9B5BE|nr:nitroreductase family protein [Maribellus maritimus]MCG6185959.1 nitroreductase family protein [Maribellus maritimus]